MEFHEAANIFPLDESNLSDLAKDIRKSGQQVPIERFEGKIIDGRRRFKACQMVGVEPQFRDVKPADPIAYVLSLNLHRRHLKPSQLAMCAARAKTLRKKLDGEARERMREGGKAGGKGRPKQGMENLPHPNDSGATRDQIGKTFGVSGKLVDQAAKVLADGTPELIDAVDNDLLAASTAAKAAGMSDDEQNRVAERAKEAAAQGHRRRPRPAENIDDEPEETDERKLRGVGVIRAHEAINCLSRIPKNDQLRKRGFQIVTDWIKRNMRSG